MDGYVKRMEDAGSSKRIINIDAAAQRCKELPKSRSIESLLNLLIKVCFRIWTVVDPEQGEIESYI